MHGTQGVHPGRGGGWGAGLGEYGAKMSDFVRITHATSPLAVACRDGRRFVKGTFGRALAAPWSAGYHSSVPFIVNLRSADSAPLPP
eukprot:5414066-Prymnesium_polylepis.1